jgi:ABC-type transporter Mla MlaB component
MIRIMKTEERSRTVITIDGQLSRESVKAIEARCSQAASNRKPVYLILRDVTTVDQAGTMLCCRLAAKGIRLLASGTYTSYVVQTLASDGAAAQVSSADTEHLDFDAMRRTL